MGHINFNFKTITVNRSWNETLQQYDATKNFNSERVVRVNNDLIDILKQLPVGSKKDPLFLNQYKTIPTYSAVNKTLKQLMKEAGVIKRGFNFQSLRHTHVAYLLAKNVNLYAISKRIGHKNITITTRVYAYMIDEFKAQTDALTESALDELLSIPKDINSGTDQLDQFSHQ